jgi:hypothetical protein
MRICLCPSILGAGNRREKWRPSARVKPRSRCFVRLKGDSSEDYGTLYLVVMVAANAKYSINRLLPPDIDPRLAVKNRTEIPVRATSSERRSTSQKAATMFDETRPRYARSSRRRNEIH